MANPSITALPDAPQRRMARDVYPVVADKWAAALGPWTTQVNAVVTWMGNQVDAIAASAKAASDSATAAGQALTEASTQAGNAKTSADAASRSLTSTETVAAAVRAQINLPSLVGQKGKFWVVNDDEKTLGLQQLTINQVGDTIISTQAPDSTWVPTGGIYLQSLYPALFAKLGRVPDFRDDQISTFFPDTFYPYSIAASGNNLVMTGYAPNQSRPEVRVSSDNGATWVVSTTNITSYATAYGNNTFVAVGYNSGSVVVSTNNGVFTGYGISNEAWRSAAFGNNLFVTVTDTGARYAVSSDNGKTWTASALPNNQACPKVVFVSGLFVAFSSTTPGVYFTSANGTSWTQRSLPAAVAIGSDGGGVVVSNGVLVLLNQTYAYTTRDGINWTTINTNLPFIFDVNYKLAAGDGVFVVQAPASVGKVFFSTNLLQWGSRSRVTVTGSQATGPATIANGFCFLTNAATGAVYRLKPVSYGASQFYGTDPIQASVGLAHFIKAAQ